MKNFSDLLAISPNIAVYVEVDGIKIQEYRASLLDDINIELTVDKDSHITSLRIDDLELVEDYNHLLPGSTNFIAGRSPWSLHIPGPFYQWRHCVTHQGHLFYQNAK